MPAISKRRIEVDIPGRVAVTGAIFWLVLVAAALLLQEWLLAAGAVGGGALAALILYRVSRPSRLRRRNRQRPRGERLEPPPGAA